MKKILVLLFFGLLILPKSQVKASHVAGADLSVECTGGDSFLISLNFFRDCSGIPAPTNADIELFNSCTTFTTTLGLVSFSDVTPICSQINSTCNNSNFPGFEKYTYQKAISLPHCPQGEWTASYTVNARNPNSNLSGTGDFHINTTFKTSLATCNTLPKFTSDPISFFCAGQSVTYTPGVIEPNGDSLDFRFAEPLNDTNTPVGFQSPYSITNPFPVPVNLNHQTGAISFTPNSAMANSSLNVFWSLKICADEYRNGVLIGTSCREIQVSIIPSSYCNNQAPYMISGGIQNLLSSNTLIDSNSFSVCNGDSFYFEVQFADSILQPYSGPGEDSISYTTNINELYQNVNISSTQGDSATLSISGTIPIDAPDYSMFFIEAKDNSCPYIEKSIFEFDVTVNRYPDAGDDRYICKGNDTAFISPSGKSSFTWSVLSGELINPSNNFSDTVNSNGKNVWSAPDTTTTYVVEPNLSYSCYSTDTITVNVGNNFNLTAIGDTTVCPADSFYSYTLDVSTDSNFNYSYHWYPDSLDNDTIKSPTANITDDQTFFITVTSSDGCSKEDSVHVEFFDGVPTYVSADQTICQNSDTALLYANSGNYFSWSVISGDSINTNNFSDTSNSNGSSVWAQPNDTTTYLVTSDLNGPCNNTDSVTVNVVPVFSLNALGDTNVCLSDSLFTFQLNANPNLNHSNLVYNWSNPSFLSSQNSKNPTATIQQSSSFKVTATIDSICSYIDSIEINFGIPTLKNAFVKLENDSICTGDSTKVEIEFDGPQLNQVCSITNETCSGNSQNYAAIGSNNNPIGGMNYPAPFGNWYWGARHQILYKATEIRSMIGSSQGESFILNSFGLDVDQIGGQNTFDNFQIFIKCTTETDLNSGWVTGLSQVYSSPSETISTGWNNYAFNQNYIWDGTSNIVVQICFNNSSYVSNGNAYTNTTNTSFTSVRYAYADQNNVCGSQISQSTSNSRPNGKFGYCAGYSPSDYSYQWYPNSNISNDTVFDPYLFPKSNYVYKLIYKDREYGVCIDTLTTPLTVLGKPEINLGSKDTVFCGSSPYPVTLSPLQNNSNPDLIWSTGDTTSTLTINSDDLYWVKATNSDGCSSFDTIIVESQPPPAIDLGPDTAVGPQHVVQLQSGYPTNTNLWSTGETSSNISVQVVSDTTIWNTVTDGNGCVGSDTIEISILTGSDQYLTKGDIKVYPNPARDNLTVRLNTESPIEFELIDLTGRILKRGSLNIGKNNLDISDLPKSNYQMRLISDDGSIIKVISVIKM